MLRVHILIASCESLRWNPAAPACLQFVASIAQTNCLLRGPLPANGCLQQQDWLAPVWILALLCTFNVAALLCTLLPCCIHCPVYCCRVRITHCCPVVFSALCIAALLYPSIACCHVLQPPGNLCAFTGCCPVVVLLLSRIAATCIYCTVYKRRKY